MEKERTKQLVVDWAAIYHIVKAAIDAWDPYELLAAFHSPPDEYDIESYEVALRIRNARTINAGEIAVIISEVFTHWLDDQDSFRPEVCLKAAKRIEDEVKQFQYKRASAQE